MSTTSSSDGYFKCPGCDHNRFSWLVKQVQFGPIVGYQNDDDVDPSPIGDGSGPIVESDTETVMCQGCDCEYNIDELEFIPNENDT